MRCKISTSKKEKKSTPTESTLLSSTVVSELNHDETLYHKAGGFGCHRIVAFCVERHYDNEHSFAIISTSWAPFPLMYFSKGNGL